MLLIGGSLRQLRVSLLLFSVTVHVTQAPAHSTSEASTECWFCKDCSAQSRTANLSNNSKELSLSPSLPKSTLEANLLAPFLLAWVGEAKGHPKFTHLYGANTGPL